MFCRCAASLHDSCACCRLQLLLCHVPGECGRSVCSCRSGVVGAGLAGSGLPCVEDACEPVHVWCSWSSLAHLSMCASRRLREPACGVAFTDAGLLPMELVEGVPALLAAPLLLGCVLWLLCVWPCVPVRCARDAELSRTVLCTFLVAVALPSRLRCIAWLSCVLEKFPRTVCCCPGEGFSQDCSSLVSAVVVPPQSLRCVVGWVVRSGEGSSQDRPLSLLVEVLPRGALCLFRATVVLPLSFVLRAVWLGYVLVRFSQDGSWRFWWRFSPKLPGVVLVVAALSLSTVRVTVCLGVVGRGGVRLAVHLAVALASLSHRSFPNVFCASVTVCHVVERVTPNFCGSACVWCPCPTMRKVWVRPSGDSGCRFRVLRVLRVCLLSLLDREEGLSEA
ncbi:hypothetical protein Taro_042894 [Colocasia esculenta]|uniref:Uncharacterized protein n=1 Tax=Colocasia esculenta TaxID=4460 RepID=A0A843WF13_COLES|nr:hypothetical protein [Colocasia esculenta]